MKILLVNPRSKDDYFRNTIEKVSFISKMMKKGSHAAFAPLALTTVAALTPEQHEVIIHDEFMQGPAENMVKDHNFDIIGITSLVNQVNRTLELAQYLRKNCQDSILVIGGPGTMKMSPPSLKLFDVVFYGEAELTWPKFLDDVEKKTIATTYQQLSKPDMNQSPIPRWELVADLIPKYGATAVQTTRGCPFDCDFCDVIYIYGRKQRSKPVSQVVEEVRLLQRLGGKLIMLADDNFGSNRAYSKELLRELIELNKSFEVPLGYMTQSDVAISEDEELLELIADCNFIQVLLGIESTDRESLKYINKKQNLRLDLLEAINKIQSYGIPVLGSLIIGMDSDDDTAFQRTIDFVEAANIMDHACHPLMAPAGTKLWYRLEKEGRLVQLDEKGRDKLDVITNIIPKKLTRAELIEGLANYSDTVYNPAHFAKRATGFIRGVKRKPQIGKFSISSFWRFRKMMMRMFWYYTFGVTSDHRKAFYTIIRSAMTHAPYLLPKMMFIYTSFLINQKRAIIAAKHSREYVAWELANPESVSIVEPTPVLSETMYKYRKEICKTAYKRVRAHIDEAEPLYKVVTEALTDYSRRFGAEMLDFDEFQEQYINESCDRILAGTIHKPHTLSQVVLPVDSPPAGFAREIMDALDYSLRVHSDAPQRPEAAQ